LRDEKVLRLQQQAVGRNQAAPAGDALCLVQGLALLGWEVCMRLFGMTVVMSITLLAGAWVRAAEELQPAAGGQQGVPDAVQGKDGAPMVLIPAGAFTMGSNEGLPAERPEHVVTLDAYAIDRYEVSLRLYRRFLQEAQRDAPPTWDDEAAETVGDRPAIGVSWADASAYCT